MERRGKQRARNWARRKAQRMGLQPKDFITDHRPMVFVKSPPPEGSWIWTERGAVQLKGRG
jgi:hypothetical protein